jgi:hypothetical protein
MTNTKAAYWILLLLFTGELFVGFSYAQDLPSKLVPPANAVILGEYKAKGVQIYVCTSHSGASEWSFKAPEASLFNAQGVLFAKHYAGPTWEASDGSKIVGRVLENLPSPEPDTIPWLLLTVTPTGSGVLANAHYVQRVKTIGGAGPKGACSQPGAEQRIPYSADYIIYN